MAAKKRASKPVAASPAEMEELAPAMAAAPELAAAIPLEIEFEDVTEVVPQAVPEPDQPSPAMEAEVVPHTPRHAQFDENLLEQLRARHLRHISDVEPLRIEEQHYELEQSESLTAKDLVDAIGHDLFDYGLMLALVGASMRMLSWAL